MTFFYFVTPVYSPPTYPNATPFPLVYAPLRVSTYSFPVPLMYSTPPPAIL
ncbi:MAG TPA: hypothetical protein VEH56_01350 [Candidatus Saccharimonadales bacterium]|nr:hypothetical protein [Candidatus Saccharimonadales bacterium]